MSSKLVIQDATVAGFRQFVSGKGKACFIIKLAFFGGCQDCFVDGGAYAIALGKFPKGTEVDAVIEGTWKEGGKFELAEEGAVELFPAGEVVIDTQAKPAAPKVAVPKAA